MKNKKKKIVLATIIIILGIISYFFIDSYLFNKKEKKPKNYAYITYIVTDYDKTKNSNFNNILTYADEILNSYSFSEVATKNGDYYEATITGMNNATFKNIAKVTFGINNTHGDVINDAKYDEKSKKIIIPKKYFESEEYSKYGGRPVRLEIVSRIKKEDYEKNEINLKINKFITTKKIIKTNEPTSKTKMSIFKFKKGKYITKDDIKVYVNNSDYSIDSKYYDYDAKTGVLTIESNPLYLNNVYVKIRKLSLFKNKMINFLHIGDTYADDTEEGALQDLDYEYKDTDSTQTDITKVSEWKVNSKRYQFIYIANGVGGNNMDYYYSFNTSNASEGDPYYHGGQYGCREAVSDVCDQINSTDLEKIDNAIDSAESGSSMLDGAEKNFYVYIDTITFQGKLKGSDTYTSTFTIKVNKWIILYCMDIDKDFLLNENPGGGLIPSGLNLFSKLTVNNARSVSISFNSYNTSDKSGNYVTTQLARGQINATMDIKAELKIQKKEYNFSNGETSVAQNSSRKGILFRVYSGFSKKSDGSIDYSDCNGKMLQEKRTNSSGTVTFKNLPSEGLYCVKELFNESAKTARSSISNKDWTRDADCNGKGEGEEKEDGSGGKVLKALTTGQVTTNDDKTNYYCNIPVKYCFRVKKQDNEGKCDDSKSVVKGIDFQLKKGSTNVGNAVTTNSSGIVTFSNLSYEDYKYEEVSKSGTKATEYCNGKKIGDHKYYNTKPVSGTAEKEELTEMDRTVKKSGNNITIEYSCPSSNVKPYNKPNNRYHYCVVVKKVDANTGAALEGAVFNATNAIGFQYNSAGAASFTLGDGLAYFYLGENDSTEITEVEAPASYALSTETISAKGVLLPDGNTATAGPEFVTACQQAYKDAGIEEAKYTMKDQKLLINWYKENENGKAVSGARFNARYTDENNSYKYIKVKMSDSGNRVKVDYPENSPQKKCYVFDSFATETQKNNLQSTEQNPVDLVSDDNGEVCIIGVPNNGKKVGDNTQAQGAYTVVETKPAKYHTFSNKKTIQLNLTTSIQAKTSNNTFTNYETEFEFTKDVSSGDSNTEIIINGVKKTLKELTTEELQKIEFNIYNSNGDILHFVKNSDGTYDFAGNDKDAPSNLTSASSALYLNQNRKLKVLHLPKGTYSIKESQGNTCSNSTDSSKCVGYYYPNYSSNSSHQFTITDCSSSKATSCTTYGVVTQKLINTPTEITFTKKDFYSYYDAADKNKSEENVKFENDKERNDFDKIVFKIKDSSGRYLTLKKVADHGNCSTDDSYSEYRYVSSDQTDKNGTELHTCGGHIKITNLCRGNEYTVEEVSVPDGSVYVKENTTSTPTSAKYQIPCTEGDTTHKTTTNIINDKPTRVRFEKRDSKYNYLIDDETTTFEVYKCKKGTECHPADYKTVAEREKNGMTLVKFSPRAVITKDEEDPTDAAGLAGVEVYKKISDSDVSKGQKYVTSLHPYKGLLILRYLESNDSNSSYVLLETVAPYNYSLPSGRNAETRFTVTNTTVKVDEIDVPNKPTSLIIRKYSDDGKLLPGAEFKVYEGTSCNSNLSAMNQPKKLLKLKTIRDGVYENRPEQDTDTVLTCTDKDGAKCSDIAVNNMTSLTYKNYQNTWADFNESLTNDNKKVQIKEGEALIQYLEYDHCYIIEETKAPKGYSLPKNDEDRFTMVTIPKNTEYVSDTYKTLINKPTPFTFYKYDEYNNLLDGAEFKLQKLDSNKKYHDITVTKEETETGVFYKVDKSTDNKVITTKDGKATVYYLEEGQYRIVETKAAPGKELGKNPNVATFFVDSAGNVYGNSIIVNKAKTETLSFTSSASAEFLIWNRTGQTVIRYGLIISSIVAVIVALMIALRIKKKSE